MKIQRYIVLAAVALSSGVNGEVLTQEEMFEKHKIPVMFAAGPLQAHRVDSTPYGVTKIFNLSKKKGKFMVPNISDGLCYEDDPVVQVSLSHHFNMSEKTLIFDVVLCKEKGNQTIKKDNQTTFESLMEYVPELLKPFGISRLLSDEFTMIDETRSLALLCADCGSREGQLYNPLHAIYSSQTAPIQNTERYAEVERNGFISVTNQPESTFSVDVDTGSYSNIRRMLNMGELPPKDAVRVEEMINYFGYQYPQPMEEVTPFSVTREMGRTPWNKESYLLHIGLQGYDKPYSELPPSNLVFLIDVSGSMSDALPLVKESLRLLVKRLRSQDTVGIVVYAGNAGTVLEPTSGIDKKKILRAIEGLQSGGSTNGGEGIQRAYRLALDSMVEGGINRVLLATDGDFNVGVTGTESLVALIERHRELGISLSTLGFGSGNYSDEMMEQLADKGNGNYAYLDSIREADRVLVQEMSSTLFTIAKDVKVQVEFNPALISEYRLIGYENRALEYDDFIDDKVDAGEIGAGHSVTALYEITLVEDRQSKPEHRRYTDLTPNSTAQQKEELAFIRLRYKQPEGEKSVLLEQPVPASSLHSTEVSDNFKLSAAVAGFGQLLSDDQYLKDGYGYQEIRDQMKEIQSAGQKESRGEMLILLGMAEVLSEQ
jgi:Ca-activated chloride channel homolog